MNQPVRGIRHEGVSWDFSAKDGRIVITQCAGPFGLPVKDMHFPVEIARSIANCVIATAKAIKPERKQRATAEGKP